MKLPKNLILIIVLIGVVIAVSLLESKRPGAGVAKLGDQTVVIDQVSSIDQDKSEKFYIAKEISTPDYFINTEEITIQELIGRKVILIDFWTYSCINCQRTMPYLNAWYEDYADQGLEIIGIHTPEFEFEKKLENVQAAVERFGIKFPVVLDNDFSTWATYQNRYWPRKYLIDIDGYVVYDHIGEGAYDETEEKIVELLNERSAKLGMEKVLEMKDREVAAETPDFEKVRTSETYFGSSRVELLANIPEKPCDTLCIFSAPVEIPLGRFALDGQWSIQPEFAQLESPTGSIVSHFSASKVNLVADTSSGLVQASIYLDGKPIAGEFAGQHVIDGMVTFEQAQLYNLVDLGGDYGEHILEIKFSGPGVQAFAFTFG